MKMLKRMLRNVKMHARKKEGQVLLDDRNNYTPLQEPMVKETSQKVKKKTIFLRYRTEIFILGVHDHF